MTLVKIDIRNVASETHPDDRVLIRSATLREASGGGLISTAETTITLVDGVGEVELAPGSVVVNFQCRGISDTSAKSGTVPDEGTVDIAEVIEDGLTFTPPVVNRALDLIRSERDHLLTDMATTVSEAVDGELGTAVRNAETAAVTAGQAATSADLRATSAESKVDSYTPRVVALEALGGLSPESPVDGQTANLIEQDDTLTREALDGLYAPVMTFFPRQEGDLDDTERFQRAVNYCATNGLPMSLKGDPHYVGVYWLRQVEIPSTLTMLDLGGATLKRPNLKIAPYSMTTAQRKWVRMLSVKHTGAGDSTTVTIRNGTLDGNCWENWDDPNTPGYEQEQASLLIASGDRVNGGRLVLTLENIKTRDNVSDGVHIVTETVATVTNLHSKDCYRGGLVMTGGGSAVVATGLIFESTRQDMPDGIDMEVDSTGYNGRRTLEATLSNVIIDRDLDVSVPAGGSVVMDNVVMRVGQWNLQSSGNLRISNSVLIQRAGSGGLFRGLGTQHRVSFSNVQFSVSGEENTGAPFPAGFPYLPTGIVEFTSCSFWGGANSVTAAGGSGIEMKFDGCAFYSVGDAMVRPPGSNVALGLKRLTINNCRFDNEGCIARLSPVSGRSSLDIGSIQVTNPLNQGLVLGNVDVSWLGNPVFNYGIAISISSGTSQTFVGSRTVIVDSDPNSSEAYGTAKVFGTEGDVAILREAPTDTLIRNPRTWRYAQFPNEAGFYFHIWEEVLRGRKVATTTRRPSSPVVSNEPFFDTTLGKPIWWNGTAWVDASGVSV